MKLDDRLRLFLLSFLLLFVELVLIRWTAAYVLYLSYFTNFVLLGSFLGIGLGFLRPREHWFRISPLLLAALVALVYFFPTRLSHAAGKGVIYFGAHAGGAPIWLALPLIFAVATLSLMTIASRAATVFGRLAPLTAYRYDILGSIAGVGSFALMSLAGATPIVWGAVIAALFLVLYGPSVRWLQLAGLAVLLVPLALSSFQSNLIWSPYYAIKTVKDPKHHSIRILVNGIPHQSIEPIKQRLTHAPYYLRPYLRLRERPSDVLVVGAGNGADVAVALRHGARHVDAVEIDPKLLHLGQTLHPNHPYQDPRVTTHVDDGRAFLGRTSKHYDLIVFALPDSLTLIAGQSSLRLESYLFTLEAFRSARAHLKEHGAFAMYNFYRQQWLVDRFAGSLDKAFGHPPCVDELHESAQLGPMANLTVGKTASAVRCAHVWKPHGDVPAPATDDHPFPYLKTASLPGFYLLTLALILAVSFGSVRAAAGRIAPMRTYLDLFFMGAAFLLLETKSVVQFALLFGTTWFVNALVFTGVLAVLLAIETAARIGTRRLPVLYALLFAALAVAWAVPPDDLLGLSIPARLAAAFALSFTPIFLANLIFAQRFKDSASSTTAFGANLIGAMVGGLLEYSSLVLGYRSLLIVIAGLYACALFAGRRYLGTRAEAPERTTPRPRPSSSPAAPRAGSAR
jgi:hypothetical protein